MMTGIPFLLLLRAPEESLTSKIGNVGRSCWTRGIGKAAHLESVWVGAACAHWWRTGTALVVRCASRTCQSREGVGETPRADMGVPGGRVKPNMQQSQVGRGANAERERSSTSEERAATGNVQECGCSLMLC
jgi:hypothetical protein